MLLPTPLLGGREDDDGVAVGMEAGAVGGSGVGVIVVDAVFAADADGMAIPRIFFFIRERRSAFTLAAISSIVSPIVMEGLWRI